MRNRTSSIVLQCKRSDSNTSYALRDGPQTASNNNHHRQQHSAQTHTGNNDPQTIQGDGHATTLIEELLSIESIQNQMEEEKCQQGRLP
eukprot:2117465-Ditylum_brightwellii.AAC.1